YGAREWAARGLLWEWDDVALGAVCAATDDDHWRVREMACRVVARHRLEGALEAVARRRADPVARVRAAAERAFVAVLSRGTGD
ncbi:MAG: HEAT repeat domain-containing protein, partial [Acidimicrobiales bacterium]